MAKPICWYRVSLDVAGKVTDIRAVDKPVDDSVRVYYVQAATAKNAGRIAWNRYCKARQRERRQRLIAEGKCAWCGAVNDRAARKRCTKCLAKDEQYRERRRARDAGAAVPELDRREALQARRDGIASELRASVLIEVENAFESMSRAEFGRWLRAQTARKGRAA